MNTVKVTDHLPEYKRSLYNVLDDALRSGARDIHIKAKERAPYRKGGLRSNSIFNSPKPLTWRISFWIEYARYQEFGGDGRRVVRRYTTPGTGAHYLQRSGDEVKDKLAGTLRMHATRARA